jgi:hypothetical protein
MANEALVKQGGGGDFIRVRSLTIADATAVALGTAMVYNGLTTQTLTAPATGRAHTAAIQERFAGFAIESKIANDGHTVIGAQATGEVIVYCDGTVCAGDFVCLSETTANRVRVINKSGSALSYQEINMICGRAITGGTNAQQVRVELGVLC